MKWTSGLQGTTDKNINNVSTSEHKLMNLTPLLVQTTQPYSSPCSSKVKMTLSQRERFLKDTF